MSHAPPSPTDVQGLVRFGFGVLKEASFLLLHIRSADAAAAWLENAPVTTAEEMSPPPQTALQVAFTVQGLRALGVTEDLLAGFSPEFLSGMAGDESRSRRLGDVGASAPQSWRWGSAENVPHMMVLIYTQAGLLESFTRSLQNKEWTAAFEVLASLPTSDLDGAEPFGFADGISQPAVDWKREREPAANELKYGNLVCLGEFLLGYPNEYGKYTHRPLIDANVQAATSLPLAEDQPTRRDFGRNGAFLIVRQLEQDVRGFWHFVDNQAGHSPSARQQLAEAMVGRKLDGTPLMPLSRDSIPGIDSKVAAQNQFTYDSDSEGVRCPFGAHVRRTNPRNADLPKSSGLLGRLLHMLGFGNPRYRDDVIASTRFHRILRRGREYGPRLSPELALTGSADQNDRGLYFICIAANILRQFEFVQNSWVMNTKFDAMTEESDPLLGNREAIDGGSRTDTFSLSQQSTVPTRILNMPQFVTVRGGAYFFLPSLTALRYLATMRRKGF